MNTDDTLPRVGITGLGETGPQLDDPRSIPEIVLDAVERALKDASIGFADIDAVVTASIDLYDGLTASNVAITEVVGAVMRPETRIAADGMCAAIHAVCQLRAGAYRTVLVVAHGKASMAPQRAIETWTMDPIYMQPLELDQVVSAGLQAQVLAAGDPEAVQRWARVAAKRRADAGRLGVAEACSAAQVIESPVVASPLRAGMCAPEADGAVAIVLSADAPGASAWIAGVGHDLAAHSLGARDLAEWGGLTRAWARALGVAGLERDARIDLFEPSCRYPHEEELCRAAARADDDCFMSPGGGLFAGVAPATGGLSRVVAATRWLRVAGAGQRAMSHGTWGPAGQCHAVALLEASS